MYLQFRVQYITSIQKNCVLLKNFVASQKRVQLEAHQKNKTYAWHKKKLEVNFFATRVKYIKIKTKRKNKKNVSRKKYDNQCKYSEA